MARVAGLTLEHFSGDEVLRAAIERKLEVVGEALSRAERAGADLAGAVPQLRKVIGLRNVLAHAYDMVDAKLIYAISVNHVPILLEALHRILATDDAE